MEILLGQMKPFLAQYKLELLEQELKISAYIYHQMLDQERRVLDYKIPLILHFKDNNKQHYRLDNIEMLCYNCFFLTIGDIFSDKQIEGLEDHKPLNNSEVDWELDPYTAQRLKELGLDNEPESDDYDIVSRI